MSFMCTKAWFVYRITQNISDTAWTMPGTGWKCIFNCLSWFVFIILNFNALCNAYTVEPRLSELIGTASTSDIGNLG